MGVRICESHEGSRITTISKNLKFRILFIGNIFKKERAFGRTNWWILSPVCVRYQTDMKIGMYCTEIVLLLADLTLISTYGMYIIYFLQLVLMFWKFLQVFISFFVLCLFLFLFSFFFANGVVSYWSTVNILEIVIDLYPLSQHNSFVFSLIFSED